MTDNDRGQAIGGSARLDPLPERARLLHIGLAKTGTTALQSTARARRAGLLDLGVRYPGGGLNHREAISALMGRRWGWLGPGTAVPGPGHWDRLLEEVEDDPDRRIWISHEFASESTDEVAQRFRDALGERLHVVITLRPFAAMLPSSWQQYLKGGTTHPFDWWLERVLAEPPDTSVTPSFHLRNDQGEVVRRWARVAGAANVTVVIVHKSRPTLLTEAFEALLGLPAGYLVDSRLGGLQQNRSMSVPESELVRRLNLAVKGKQVQWDDYERLIRGGAIARLLESRPDAAAEPVLLPTWAAELATARGTRFAEQIATSGVRLVGDPLTLAEPVPVRGPDRPAVTSVGLDLAVESMAGLFSAALGRGASFDDVETGAAANERERAARAMSGIKLTDAASVLISRTGRRLLVRARRTVRRKSSL